MSEDRKKELKKFILTTFMKENVRLNNKNEYETTINEINKLDFSTEEKEFILNVLRGYNLIIKGDNKKEPNLDFVLNLDFILNDMKNFSGADKMIEFYKKNNIINADNTGLIKLIVFLYEEKAKNGRFNRDYEEDCFFTEDLKEENFIAEDIISQVDNDLSRKKFMEDLLKQNFSEQRKKIFLEKYGFTDGIYKSNKEVATKLGIPQNQVNLAVLRGIIYLRNLLTGSLSKGVICAKELSIINSFECAVLLKSIELPYFKEKMYTDDLPKFSLKKVKEDESFEPIRVPNNKIPHFRTIEEFESGWKKFVEPYVKNRDEKIETAFYNGIAKIRNNINAIKATGLWRADVEFLFEKIYDPIIVESESNESESKKKL